MDGDWFRTQHRLKGVSQTQLAAAMGRSPTFLTRVYNGEQQMRVSEAGEIARRLELDLSEVLRRAGLNVAGARTEPLRQRGFEESDVEPFHGVDAARDALHAQGPAQSVWTVQGDDMVLAGYLPGDRLLLDGSVGPARGDAVIAQLYDWRADTAQTVLRLYLPPYLIRPSVRAEAPVTVDGETVMIKGTVIGSWRQRHGIVNR